MPPKDNPKHTDSVDSTNANSSFHSVVVRAMGKGNFLATVYLIGAFGSKLIKQIGFNLNAETLLIALHRNGYRTRNSRETEHLLMSNYDGLVVLVRIVD